MGDISSTATLNQIPGAGPDSFQDPLGQPVGSAPVSKQSSPASDGDPSKTSPQGETAPSPPAAFQARTPEQLSVAYRVDKKAQQIYIQFVDSKTGTVVNQLPPSQVLAFEDQVAQFLQSRHESQPATAEAENADGVPNAKDK
jgi:FlaG protein